MKKTEMKEKVTLKIEPKLKEEATELFKELGLDMSTATEIFYHQAIRCHGFPFEVRQPRYNAETEAAMKEAHDIMAGTIEAKRYHSVDDACNDALTEDTVKQDPGMYKTSNRDD